MTFGNGTIQTSRDMIINHPFPNGIYKHQITVTDDVKTPSNKMELIYFYESNYYENNFKANIQ